MGQSVSFCLNEIADLYLTGRLSIPHHHIDILKDPHRGTGFSDVTSVLRADVTSTHSFADINKQPLAKGIIWLPDIY
ncbi:hypothetical protein NPIL_130701 [Nephila pilipes]|uniref:Uncharacterized protein n=1 Tax=Nephila pilipes TaxID=299642 RepID=A0A8X6T8Z3_NEPPI|nr:hypothetical protein NPIL_130701 [Nephila pilipes]